MKKKKKTKIANMLLRNYVFLYLLMTFIFIVCLIISLYAAINSIKKVENTKLVASNIMKDNYKTIDISNILKVNGFIEIIDKNLNVIYSKGTNPDNKKKYTRQEYHKMLLKNPHNNEYEDNYIYSFAYNKRKDFLLVTAVPAKNLDYLYPKRRKMKLNIILKLVLFFYLTTLILGIRIYSKLTSKNFVAPLKVLLNGVKKITKGDYSTRIKLNSENEFGDLKNAFNLMAHKIEEERMLKKESEDSRRRLIMDISHDLKNPLASIIGYTDLLIKTPNLNHDERIKYLTIIENNSIRTNNLIKDLFELSKFKSTDFNLKLKKGDIYEFLRETIASYIPQMDEKGILYDFEIPEESLYINFDDKNLYRAISNLITNSINYNLKGTTLKMYAKNTSNIVEIIISDNGIGIPKKLVNNIFEPFVRVDSSRNSKLGGTGLGLAITKTLIEKHNGTIALETDLDKGCRFIITLNI